MVIGLWILSSSASAAVASRGWLVWCWCRLAACVSDSLSVAWSAAPAPESVRVNASHHLDAFSFLSMTSSRPRCDISLKCLFVFL